MLEAGYDYESACKARLCNLFERMQPDIAPTSFHSEHERGVEHYQSRVSAVFGGLEGLGKRQRAAPPVKRAKKTNHQVDGDTESKAADNCGQKESLLPPSSMPPPLPKFKTKTGEREGFTKYELDLQRPESAQPTSVIEFLNEVGARYVFS